MEGARIEVLIFRMYVFVIDFIRVFLWSALGEEW